jgi:CheY-like chemotaxis protein
MQQELKVLIADDSDDVSQTLRYRLELEPDIKVFRARDGLETLRKVREVEPDVILLDVMMPGLNGYRVSRAIREDESLGIYAETVTIILVTGRDLSWDPDREAMFQDFSGADAVMYKPFDLEALVGKVVEVWMGWRPHPRVAEAARHESAELALFE